MSIADDRPYVIGTPNQQAKVNDALWDVLHGWMNARSDDVVLLAHLLNAAAAQAYQAEKS